MQHKPTTKMHFLSEFIQMNALIKLLSFIVDNIFAIIYFEVETELKVKQVTRKRKKKGKEREREKERKKEFK